jgi:1,2-dihydroxy-3-keto-5-methylthiopentene dioxygenase
MRAYYYDNLPGDQRLPHDCIPSQPVSAEVLTALGIKFWTIPVEGYESQLDAIAKERGYKNRDTINVSKEGLGEVCLAYPSVVSQNRHHFIPILVKIYEEKIKGFFQEYACVVYRITTTLSKKILC